MMWEWFVANRLWVFIASIIGFILAYLLKDRAARAVEKAVTKRWRRRLRHIHTLVSWIIFGIAGGVLGTALATVIASYYQVDIIPNASVVRNWFWTRGIPILIIAVPALIAHRVIRATLPRLIHRLLVRRGKDRVTKERLTKRSHTLSNVITSTMGIIIATVAAFLILSNVGINITPLLAGAGVAGIAIGFGAQTMIKDLIAGFFIIIEDQYDIGDVIKVNNQLAGGVEELNIRRTVLRDLDGILHIIPNGQINIASNLTRTWSRAHLNISVAYKEDLDRVMAVIKGVWEETAEDPNWGPFLIEKTPWLLRVDEFGDSGIVIKAVGQTEPGQQWNVMGELRRRIKKAFDQEGIEIPWPHVKLYLGDKPAGTDIACQACSQPNPPSSKFCSKCGAKLGSK